VAIAAVVEVCCKEAIPAAAPQQLKALLLKLTEERRKQ
jgi:hypothetical protein